jgi:hypothetical protein
MNNKLATHSTFICLEPSLGSLHSFAQWQPLINSSQAATNRKLNFLAIFILLGFGIIKK